MKLQYSTLFLILSLISYLIAKTNFVIPSSMLQSFGILFLITAAILGKKKPPDSMIIVISIASCFLVIGWVIGSGHIAGLFNAFFILCSFPLAVSLSKSFNSHAIFWMIIFIILGICFVGLLNGSFSVTYFGDYRTNRWVLGFSRPTFLCEAMFLMLIALCGVHNKNKFWMVMFPLAISIILAIQFQSGSRAGLGASLLFLYIAWEGRVLASHRFYIRFIVTFFVVLVLLSGASKDLNINILNTLTSGRIDIVIQEVTGNLREPLHWLLGNSNAQDVTLYFNERNGIIYHMDNFYVERLVSSGLIGIGFIITMTTIFTRGKGRLTRAVVAALLFYGLFENGIFNITSGFASFTLILAAFLAQKSNFFGQEKVKNYHALITP